MANSVFINDNTIGKTFPFSYNGYDLKFSFHIENQQIPLIEFIIEESKRSIIATNERIIFYFNKFY